MEEDIHIKLNFGNCQSNVRHVANMGPFQWYETEFSIDELKELFGLDNSFNDNDLEEGKSWNVNAVLESSGEDWTDHGESEFIYYLSKLYAGDDLSEIDDTSANEEDDDAPLADLDGAMANAANAAKTIKDIVSKDIVKKFLKNPIGFIMTPFFDGIRMLIADNIQVLANILTFSDVKIEYDYAELKSKTNSAVNEYVNVGKYNKAKAVTGNKSTTRPKIIHIAKDTINTDEEDRKFSTTTKIPYIKVDLFNVATGGVDIFDINFISVNSKLHDSASTWMHFRTLYAELLRMEIVICAMYLIGVLIFNGIKFVRSGFSNPDEHLESKNTIERFIMAAFMLVGTVFVISLAVYLSKYLTSFISIDSSKELPIRVYSEEANYCFSTNLTGYYRYMSCIEGINNYADKGEYTILYLVLAFTNFAVAFFMLARLVLMMVLSISGPIIAVSYARGSKRGMKYSSWILSVFCIAISEIFFVLGYSLIERFFI